MNADSAGWGGGDMRRKPPVSSVQDQHRARPSPSGLDEQSLLMRLRDGDEAAFADLVGMYHPAMVRLALLHVRSRAVAEEVAQEAWLGLLRGLDRFEGRSSLRTWLFRIVINRAISTGIREQVHVPVTDDELELRDGRFSQDGWWVTPPAHWADEVLDRMTAPALVAQVRRAIAELPALQRNVVTLRDVDGLTAAEVCKVLDISEVNQRVQLHRARTRIRSTVEQEVLQ